METAGMMQQAQREKTWDEKDTEERIHTLAMELAYVIERNQWLQARVDRLEDHRHDNASGALLTPLNGRQNLPEHDGRRGIRYRLGLQR